MPWGSEFDFMQIPQQDFQFPIQDFRQDTFAQGMNGSPYASLFGGGNTPAISRYQEYLGNTPTRESYQPGILGKILASIAGASAGYRDPAAGVQTAMSIMDTPYQRAVEQYKLQEPGLRQSAAIEERQLNDKNAAMRQLFDQNRLRSEQQMKQKQFDQEMQFKYADLEQKKAEAIARASNASETARINEAYNNARIGIDAEYNRIRELDVQNRQYGTMEDYLKNSGLGMPAQQPNASMLRLQLQQRLYSDPMFRGIMTPNGVNPNELTSDQLDRYQQILSELGILR